MHRAGSLDRESSSTGLVAALLAGLFVALYVLEVRRPLRQTVESKQRRAARNLAVAALGATALSALAAPLTARACRYVEQHRSGLVQRLPIAARLRVPLAVVLLDYT